MYNTFISETRCLWFLLILSILWWQKKHALMVIKILCFTILPKNICSLLHRKHKNGEESFNLPLHKHTFIYLCNWCLLLCMEENRTPQDLENRHRMTQIWHLSSHLLVTHLCNDSSSLEVPFFFSGGDSFPLCFQLILHQTLKSVKISVIKSCHFSKRWFSFSLIPKIWLGAPLCHYCIVFGLLLQKVVYSCQKFGFK